MTITGVRRNMLANVAYFVLQLVLMMYFTRLLIGTLGAAVYGLVPLATSTVAFLTVFTSSLNASTGRYLTADVARDDHDSAENTFSMAFWAGLILVAALVPLAAIVSWYTPTLFDVPAGSEAAARLLFAAVYAGFLAATLLNPMAAASFAKNRIDLWNLNNALQLIVRVAAPVILILGFAWTLQAVVAGYISATVVYVLGAIMVWRFVAPELTLRRPTVDWKKLQAMGATGGWVLVNQVGALLFLSTDMIIVNKMLGPAEGGRFGSILLFATALRSGAALLAGAITPLAVHRFARHEIGQLGRLGSSSTRLLGVLLALPVGLVAGLASPLLHVWLGAAFVGLSWPLFVMTIHLCVNLAVIPLFSLQIAANRVRVPGIVTLFSGVVDVCLCVALVTPSVGGLGLLGIALADAVSLSLKNVLFTPVYCARILGLAWTTFLKAIVPGALGTAFAAGLSSVAVGLTKTTSWTGVIGIAALVTILYAVFAWRVLLRPDDRTLARQLASPHAALGESA